MPSSGVWPSLIGESWLAVEYSFSPEPSCTSQLQPEPKRATPFWPNVDLKSSKEPNAEVIASPSAPDGAPPPFGPITVQNSEWLAWPPALLRTGPCLSAGRLDRLFRTSSTLEFSHCVPASALFAFVTYAWWCLE